MVNVPNNIKVIDKVTSKLSKEFFNTVGLPSYAALRAKNISIPEFGIEIRNSNVTDKAKLQ